MKRSFSASLAGAAKTPSPATPSKLRYAQVVKPYWRRHIVGLEVHE